MYGLLYANVMFSFSFCLLYFFFPESLHCSKRDMNAKWPHEKLERDEFKFEYNNENTVQFRRPFCRLEQKKRYAG